MNFGKAIEALKAGKKIKLPSWKGYWVKEGNTIKMYCKDGRILDIRESEDVFYTLSNIVSDEWEVVDSEEIDYVHTFSFGEAIRNLKAGKKVARKGWNGKGMHLILIKGKCIHNAITECYGDGIAENTPEVLDSIAMYTAQKQLVVGWLASQTDMLAEDWIVVE